MTNWKILEIALEKKTRRKGLLQLSVKNGLAYITVSDLTMGLDGIQSKGDSKGSSKKRKKLNEEVKSFMEVQDETRQNMTDAITLLNASARKGDLSERELSFQKEIWESKKNCMTDKLTAKYDYKY